jgi:hypothetical protein
LREAAIRIGQLVRGGTRSGLILFTSPPVGSAESASAAQRIGVVDGTGVLHLASENDLTDEVLRLYERQPSHTSLPRSNSLRLQGE